jgi:hypothetical protein
MWRRRERRRLTRNAWHDGGGSAWRTRERSSAGIAAIDWKKKKTWRGGDSALAAALAALQATLAAAATSGKPASAAAAYRRRRAYRLAYLAGPGARRR